MISRAHALQPSSAEATEHDVPLRALLGGEGYRPYRMICVHTVGR
jgi:hypothetical protein